MTPPTGRTSERDNCCWSRWTAGCFLRQIRPLVAKIGDLTIPRSLYTGFDPLDGHAPDHSGRDSDNNIIVYWSATAGSTPADASKCWLYVSRLNVWDETTRPG